MSALSVSQSDGTLLLFVLLKSFHGNLRRAALIDSSFVLPLFLFFGKNQSCHCLGSTSTYSIHNTVSIHFTIQLQYHKLNHVWEYWLGIGLNLSMQAIVSQWLKDLSISIIHSISNTFLSFLLTVFVVTGVGRHLISFQSTNNENHQLSHKSIPIILFFIFFSAHTNTMFCVCHTWALNS